MKKALSIISHLFSSRQADKIHEGIMSARAAAIEIYSMQQRPNGNWM